MRIEITYKDNSKDTYTGVASYSDMMWVDDWFWVDIGDSERHYVSISTIKRIKIVKEESK